MSAIVRPASARDWDAIVMLLEQHRLPLAGARDHVSDFLVTVDDGSVIGVAGLEMYGDAALLRSVAVSSPGGGVGTRLVEALLEQARQAGVGTVVLLTTTAAAFFPRFGFTEVTRDDVPAAVRASAEFQGACPASATVMRLALRREKLT
ncbi:arsenic resistance N-acetyltransferase ArsN2 [Luteitalea pratensis]|uniref:arsenic resistance N-acetyltransferase ArsN2 n=1 Tax=Luteitalea pratensis TaxID=1855912 RepID=UPI000D734BFB|nr:arsenic resistance N-acetyltransferase ArsN2 [Luteitalea pratensis]